MQPRIQSEQVNNDVLFRQIVFNNIESLSSFLAQSSPEEAIINNYPPIENKDLKERKFKTINSIDLSGIEEVTYYSPLDQVISIGTGITLSKLSALISKNNLVWPVITANEETSLVNLLNGGYGGSLEHQYGRLSNLILGMTVVLSNGNTIKCGGKVVKNVSGYDLGKLFLGTYGYFGIVANATLRLYAKPEKSITLLFKFATINKALQSGNQLLFSNLPLSCLEITNHINANNGNYILARIDGSAEKVSKVTDSVLSLLKPEIQSSDTMENESSLWKQMSDHIPKSGKTTIDFNLPITNMAQFTDELQKIDDTLIFKICPKLGRLVLFLANDKLNRAIDTLSVLAQQNQKFITATCIDSESKYQLNYLPNRNKVIDNLTNDMKKAYDPKGNLNPQIAL